jgi:hypothetical protein
MTDAAALVRLSLAPYAPDADTVAINLATPVPIGRGRINAQPSLRVHALPAVESLVAGVVLDGTLVELWGRWPGWWLIDNPVGWVSDIYVQRS